MKETLKLAAHVVALVLVSPFILVYFLGAAVLGRDRAIEGMTPPGKMAVRRARFHTR